MQTREIRVKAESYNRLCYPSSGLFLVLDIIFTKIITTTVSAAELLLRHKAPARGRMRESHGCHHNKQKRRQPTGRVLA